MRVTTAFNRLLRLPGASVTDVEFSPIGVIVTVGLKGRRRVCGRCGQLAGHVHGRRTKRWRHLDLGASQCFIECELRRVWCPDCGVRSEAVPWARAGARHTRDFEDAVAWLAQQMAKTPIKRLRRTNPTAICPKTTAVTARGKPPASRAGRLAPTGASNPNSHPEPDPPVTPHAIGALRG